MAKYVIKKMQDDGYYWKVVDRKTRVTKESFLSKFDAQLLRDRLNGKPSTIGYYFK